MMRAKDFRARAREALRGKWGVAVAAGLVATLLSAGAAFSSSGSTGEGYLSSFNHDAEIMMMTLAAVWSLVALVIGGAVTMGWSGFNLKLVKGEEVRFRNLFDHFHEIWRGFCMNFVMGLFLFLWLLPMLVVLIGWILYYADLFWYSPDFMTEAVIEDSVVLLVLLYISMIPYIIAALRYSMMPFLMAEFPELRAMDAIRESKRLMKGNKWRLFCLEMSFFGWLFLSVLTMGIGILWLEPYMRASFAVFYLDVTGRSQPEGWEQPRVIQQPPTADPWDRPQNPEL